MALLLGLAGCETNKDQDRDERDADRLARRERRRERDRLRDDDTVIASRRDRLDDRTSRRTRGMEEIPSGATEVEGGLTAGRLEYEPTRDGVVYVYDEDDDQVIYVARVRDGERFRLEAENDRATINTRTVFRGDLNPRHRYRLYFDRAG
jgi:hypothetical protein